MVQRKNIFIFLITLGSFMMTGCGETYKSDQTNKINQTIMEEDTKKIETNKKLVRLWIEDGWNLNRNKEVVDKVFAKDWVDGNPTFPDQPKGIEGAMYFVTQYRNALPDLHFNITHLIADPEYVTFRFEATGTHKGMLMGIPATGKKITVSGIVIHKVETGRFSKSWNEVDLLGLKMQLEQK